MYKIGGHHAGQAMKSTVADGEHVPHYNVDSVALGALPCVTPGASSEVAFDGSVASGALTATLVRLVATQDCHLAFAAAPTAVADGTCLFLPAYSTEYFRVTSGDKIAAIKDSVAGNLFITVCG